MQAIGDWPGRQLPCAAMGTDALTLDPHAAIAIRIDSARPLGTARFTVLAAGSDKTYWVRLRVSPPVSVAATTKRPPRGAEAR
jgi:hypothetical protein